MNSNNTSTTPFLPEHIRVLEERSIPLDYAQKCGIKSFRKPNPAQKASLKENFPGLAVHDSSFLLIEYQDQLDNRKVARLRYDDAVAWGGEPGTDDEHIIGEIPRYSAQKGVDVRPYFPPDVRLVRVTSDPSIPIAIVEAPLKAISLSANGISTIGLGGVEAGAHDVHEWRSNRKLVMNQELSRVLWKGRTAPIIYDAGVQNNPRVALGSAKLASVLKTAGAIPRLVLLPLVARKASWEETVLFESVDQGPDDFIRMNGVDELKKLIANAIPADPYDRCQALIDSGLSKDALTREFRDLLSDMTFVAALSVSGGEGTVATLTKKYGVGVKDLKRAVSDFETLVARKQEADPEWMNLLTRDAAGRIKSTLGNVATILANDPLWDGTIAYDLFADYPCWLKEAPWDADCKPHTPFVSGQMSDEQDPARLVAWMDKHYDLHISVQTAIHCLEMSCRTREFHPVRDYLASLTWDGVPRVERLYIDYAGAEDCPYHKIVARCQMVSSVARVMNPGCKVDTLPVLEGDQGKRKSSFLRELYSPQWFSDSLSDLSKKDAYGDLVHKWCVEWAEMDTLSKHESSTAKKFISKQSDYYRPSYARRNKDVKRQCVFCGTVNGDSYLKDTTGNRRYHPVLCVEFDLEAIKAIRDQLWAEAYHMYISKVQWWPTKEEEKMFKIEQDKRRQPHPWEAIIASFLEDKTETCTKELLSFCLRIKSKDQHRGQETQVGQSMQIIGWHKVRQTSDARDYFYAAPEKEYRNTEDVGKECNARMATSISFDDDLTPP